MLVYLYQTDRHIDEQDLEANNISMMHSHNEEDPFCKLVKQLENSQRFASAGEKYIINIMMITKSIALLSQTFHYNTDIKT